MVTSSRTPRVQSDIRMRCLMMSSNEPEIHQLTADKHLHHALCTVFSVEPYLTTQHHVECGDWNIMSRSKNASKRASSHHTCFTIRLTRTSWRKYIRCVL